MMQAQIQDSANHEFTGANTNDYKTPATVLYTATQILYRAEQIQEIMAIAKNYKVYY